MSNCLCFLAFKGKSAYQCCGSALVSVRIRIQHFSSLWIQIPHFSEHETSQLFSACLGYFCPPGSESGSSRPKLMRILIQIHNTGALKDTYCFDALVLFWNPVACLSCCSLSYLFFASFHAVVIDHITEGHCSFCMLSCCSNDIKEGYRAFCMLSCWGQKESSFCMLSCCGHRLNRKKRSSLVLHAFMLWS
jgi:hypothetical protein